jgi:glycosyltransferase involved in cell wall biosynthesis
MPEAGAALLLPGDAFDTDQLQVMGRRVAGRSMAHGMAKHLQPGHRLHLIALEASERQRLVELLQPALPAGCSLAVSGSLNPQQLSERGCLHLPEPGLGKWTLLRSGGPAHAFSLTGVIHTLCSAGVCDALEELLTAPLQPWDALICTSTAGRTVVQTAMAAHHEALERRFGHSLAWPEGPQLPLIPLAIDPDPWHWQPQFSSRQEQRRRARQQLGLPIEARIVLFVGRLSFHSKAHPGVLYRALAAAAALDRENPVLLLECGHFFSAEIADAWQNLERCHPQLTVHRLGGLTPASEAEKALALAAADLFCSPSDNLQETFGLSLLEAMAAELPVIASDWNGYRDLVEHGRTGLLVPTADPLAGADPSQPDGLEISYRLGLLGYDQLVAQRSLAVVVDERSLTNALVELISDSDRCHRMGEQGRRKLEQQFSWAVVAGQYRNLWRELAERRLWEAAHGPSNRQFPPDAPQARLFRHYATHALDLNGPWRRSAVNPKVLLDPMQAATLNSWCSGDLAAIVQWLDQWPFHQTLDNEATCSQLQTFGVSSQSQPQLLSALLKLGILEKQE